MLSSSDGNPAAGTAYIMNAVGPGATPANIVAGPVAVTAPSGTPTLVTVFSGVNLPQGATYFLVIQANTDTFQWNFSGLAVETTSAAPLVTTNSDGISGPPPTTPAYNAAFVAPGSPSKGLLFDVSGDPPADVSITKSGPATAFAGNNIVYTTVVTNTSGANPAMGVSVADTTPAGLTFVSNSGACATAFPCSLGTIAASGTATITSTYTIASTFTGSVSNTATVSTTTFDLNAANNSSTASTTVSASTDIAITKTGAATATAGNNIVYTVTVTNNGPSTATGVSVADTTPANLTFVSNSGGCTTAYP